MSEKSTALYAPTPVMEVFDSPESYKDLERLSQQHIVWLCLKWKLKLLKGQRFPGEDCAMWAFGTFWLSCFVEGLIKDLYLSDGSQYTKFRHTLCKSVSVSLGGCSDQSVCF